MQQKDSETQNYNQHKKWYKRSKKERKELARFYRKNCIVRNRKFVENYKMNHPCSCGEKESCALSFHHHNGEDKDANISDMVNRGYSLKRIIEEINKCIVMCLNCHAKIHNNHKQNNNNVEKQNNGT